MTRTNKFSKAGADDNNTTIQDNAQQQRADSRKKRTNVMHVDNCSGAGSAAPRSTKFGQFVKAVSEEAIR